MTFEERLREINSLEPEILTPEEEASLKEAMKINEDGFSMSFEDYKKVAFKLKELIK